MDDYVSRLTPKEWEKFCEVMLRQHYKAKNFWPVPDEDQGDLGLEFFTIDGTLFQCYYPDKGIEMSLYKSRVQRKIREDLKKLKTNEDKIGEMLDGIIVDQWVLMMPEFKSKELIPYCQKKKKEVVREQLSFIDGESFSVKIETADSYLSAKRYAQGVFLKEVNIPIKVVSQAEQNIWEEGHSEFSGNISRKTSALMGDESVTFRDAVTKKYIQVDAFLDQLRYDYPDLMNQLEDAARAQLEDIREGALLEADIGREFIRSIVTSNKEAFDMFSTLMSSTNKQLLRFGYLSKWLAECSMDFVE